ncbi:helix-turn-helix transcriptional regulator [Paraburkholderia kururiensis]|uniref:AlpA family phage regulatory protein n=1 Tax=Paraburkholderia kururiensis TaxID=984307 RepID=A0ABZ0WDT0_9BURK|nr:AlpA family phage regulatory protein [Paraburkholderia kururiensis]WQD75490.1 AlpA family phage regulatory protein [Paraburkholderia kururiensis]
MTQKTLLSTGAAEKATQALSPIAQIRRGRRSQSADTSDSAHSSVTTDSPSIANASANIAYVRSSPLLDKLIAQVRSCSHDRLMKEREVLPMIGRSKAAMRRDVSLGLFPKQVKTGTKSSAWRESEVMGWIEAATILSRVAAPGFGMKDFVAALDARINVEVNA